jgi:hypothetical protein
MNAKQIREMTDDQLNRWIARRKGWVVQQFDPAAKHGWMRVSPGPNKDRCNYRNEKEAWDEGPYYCTELSDAGKLLADMGVQMSAREIAEAWAVWYLGQAHPLHCPNCGEFSTYNVTCSHCGSWVCPKCGAEVE